MAFGLAVLCGDPELHLRVCEQAMANTAEKPPMSDMYPDPGKAMLLAFVCLSVLLTRPSSVP